MFVDSLATAHYGTLRTAPPATGVEPQRDALLSAHLGFFVIIEDTDTIIDDTFCIRRVQDDDFLVVLTADDTFCVTLVDDEPFEIALQVDDTFCVVLIDDDEVQL